MEKKYKVWIEGTIVAALALVLSFIPLQIGSSFSISLGQIPLTLFALRRGWKAGIFAGFIWGILHFPTGQVYYLSVIQVLIEYPIAFTFAGFAGLFSSRLQQSLKNGNKKGVTANIVWGTFVGVGARYFWHFVAGVVFWGSYALWGMNPWLFSLVMNGASGLATGIVTLIVLLGIKRTIPSLFTGKK
ncbi:energy-coupled thiamine transporter ThiT [Enterococcus villorum]|jgi:thiamine transporter|uniref:Thiamine transporter thia n=2 Tax=Enterococcus villorum TaxID=112904 RepID=A0A511J0G6_9ENTE|nr:energy-coupled thiamine transporter ThiT [Enterococcus villorum]EOH94093.1 thiamin permease [Enterococcus villorum ATCC 700913]EOW77117.1 thiamin permease [Enterococcus villorum ATCC 700913]GEL91511.1 thiamine transporter thia [Enterococcus villorum]